MGERLANSSFPVWIIVRQGVSLARTAKPIVCAREFQNFNEAQPEPIHRRRKIEYPSDL